MTRDDQTAAILGAAFEVHNELGFGFLENVYLEALCLELTARSIPFEREVGLVVYYRETLLPCRYRVDLICYGSVIVELKATVGLSEMDEAQVLNYLRATTCERALLLNFGTPRMQYKRLILSNEYRRRGGG